MRQSGAHSMFFVAIICPPSVDKKVLQYKRLMKEQFGCIVALKSPAHITLIPPFWLEDEREKALVDTLQLFSSDIDTLKIHLNGFSHFGKRVLFVKVNENPALEEVKKQVENHFIKVFNDVFKKGDRTFHPHVTIANRDIKPSDFLTAWQYFSQKEFNEIFPGITISLLKLSSGQWNIIGEKTW